MHMSHYDVYVHTNGTCLCVPVFYRRIRCSVLFVSGIQVFFFCLYFFPADESKNCDAFCVAAVLLHESVSCIWMQTSVMVRV